MARVLQIFGLIVLALPLSGSYNSFRNLSFYVPSELEPGWNSIHNHWSRREYAIVIPEAQSLARTASERGYPRAQARILAIAAGAQGLNFQYRAAVESYYEVRRLAEQVDDLALVALASFNLSNLYFRLGAFVEAEAALRRADELATVGNSLLPRTPITIHQARLAARTKGIVAARPLLRQALQLARRDKDQPSIALVQDLTAVQLWDAGELDQAAECAEDAVQIRARSHDALLSTSLLTLSRIRLSQGRAREALRMAERAFDELQHNSPQRPIYLFYFHRGAAHAALGDWEAARADLRLAVGQLKLLRAEVLPAETVRIRTAANQQEVFAALAEVCNEIHLRSHRSEDLWEAFAAANENRAWAMRQALDHRGDPGPEYATTLSALQKAELELLRNPSSESLAALSAARLRLAEIESSSDSSASRPASAPDLNRFQAGLSRNAAVVQFQIGAHRTYAWVLTRNGLDLIPLGPAAPLEAGVRRFRRLIEADSPESGSAGHALYLSLFGALPKSAQAAKRWTLLPDQFLYEIPFAALVTSFQGTRPRYLAEDVALQFAPFLAAGSSRALAANTHAFTGFGDPIYNTADPRAGSAAAQPGWFQWAHWSSNPQNTFLPRLPGTALEVKRSARAWGELAKVYTGAQVNQQMLRAALVNRPEVLHLATHLVPGAADPAESRLLLSLSESGLPEILGPADISHLPAQCALVVMSGCRAGAADAVASEGLLGLSRAWLAAGVSSVLATQWAMPDDAGEMWDSFYSAWHTSELPPGSARASVALQTAQKELIASNSWRARPRFWASYFVIGSR